MDVSVDIVKAKDGTEILQWNQDGRKYALNSTYRPLAEAETFTSQYGNLEPGSILVVFGFGNGIFPEALVKMCTKLQVIPVFYEPSREVIASIKGRLSLQAFCKKNHCPLVSCQDWEQGEYLFRIEEFPLLLERIINYRTMTKVCYCVLPKYKDLFPEEYAAFKEQVEFRIAVARSNGNTNKKYAHRAVRNHIQNLRYLLDSYCSDDFVGLFPEELPAIIVSAGPSLEKNIHILKEAKGKAFILCVDTAIRKVLQEGIVPDMMISVDSRKALHLFEDDRIIGIPVAGVMDINTEVLDKLKGSPIVFIDTKNKYVQKLYRMSGHEIANLQLGASVATAAYAFCQYMGFKRIILVGQDLALTGNQMYAGGQKLNMESFQRNVLPVEDISGGITFTTTDYYMYLKWFEQRIAAYPDIQVIDATEGGAKIKGSTIMPLQDALDVYGMEDCDIAGCLASVKPAFDEEQKIRVKEDIMESRRRISNLIVQLKNGVELAEKGIQMTDNPMATEAQYIRLNKKLDAIGDYYGNMDEWYLVRYELEADSLDEYTELLDQHGAKTLKQAYEDMRNYFSYSLQAAKKVKMLYDEFISDEKW